jgi:hypothetical protein
VTVGVRPFFRNYIGFSPSFATVFCGRWIRSGWGNTEQGFPTGHAMTDQGQTTLFVMDQCNHDISKVIE